MSEAGNPRQYLGHKYEECVFKALLTFRWPTRGQRYVVEASLKIIHRCEISYSVKKSTSI